MKAEIESYKAGVNNTKTIAIGQLNIYRESFLKFTGKKEINAKAVSGARSKLAGFIHKTFVSEKIFFYTFATSSSTGKLATCIVMLSMCINLRTLYSVKPRYPDTRALHKLFNINICI